MCLARAIVTARAKAENHRERVNFRDAKPGRDKVQREEAIALCQLALVDPTVPSPICDLRKFHIVIPEYQLIVLSKEYFNSIIFRRNPYTMKTGCTVVPFSSPRAL